MFDWEATNLEHIAKYGFTPEAAEVVIFDTNRIQTETYNSHGERRYSVIGRDIRGGVLDVVFVTGEGPNLPLYCRVATAAEKGGTDDDAGQGEARENRGRLYPGTRGY